MKFILFLALVFLAYFFARFVLNTLIEARKNNLKDKQTQEPKSDKAEAMVRCAHCGVHLPQGEAYFSGEHTFCSEGHLEQGPKLPNQKSQ